MTQLPLSTTFFFFNDTATTEIYTLSLHDALPILSPTMPTISSGPLPSHEISICLPTGSWFGKYFFARVSLIKRDRKSTRLNSSHDQISYAVFCLKKKNYR